MVRTFAVLSIGVALGILISSNSAALAQFFGVTSCTLTSPCIGGSNAGTGPGAQGTSAKGPGVVAQTKFNSTGAANGQRGLFGQDLSTSGGFDEGVRGTSVRGIGVHGISKVNAGVQGDSTSGDGVVGKSSSNLGVLGLTTTGQAGVWGATANAIGVFGNASGTGTGLFLPSSVGVLGLGGSEGVEGSAGTSGDSLFANGSGGNLIRANNNQGIDVFTLADDGTANFTGRMNVGGTVFAGGTSPLQSVGLQGLGDQVGVEGVELASSGGTAAVTASGSGALLFDGNNSLGLDVFYVDDAGVTHAHQFVADLAAASLQRTAAGEKLVTYSAQASSPQIEDVGEAALTNGEGYVRIDSRFAATMAGGNYLVFLTPQGPAQLYVSQKSAQGFFVRELSPGRSSVAFDYRIVARPYGQRYERLPSAASLTANAPHTSRIHPPSIPNVRTHDKKPSLRPHGLARL